MTKDKEPPPEKDSIEKLAEFTKRILQVPRSELQDRRVSGKKTIDHPGQRHE